MKTLLSFVSLTTKRVLILILASSYQQLNDFIVQISIGFL